MAARSDPPHPGFPSTAWSRIALGNDEDPRAAWEELARRYAGPVAGYVRTRWARTDEAARDLTQEFFLRVFEGGLLARADPVRGSFRAFLKTALANFVRDLARREGAARRGGRDRHVPLDDAALPEAGERAPDEVLDDLWRAQLVGEALARLERALRAEDKGQAFEIFRAYHLAEDDVDYAALAARHGVSRVDVSNALARTKRRFRDELRRGVLETVGADEDLRAELGWLFEGARE